MKRWTLDERAELRRIYPRSDDAELARRFGTTVEEVQAEASRHALGKDKAKFRGAPMPRWSAEELERLQELYPSHSNREIARVLGRTEASVTRQGARLGLRKSEARRALAGVENVQLRRVAPPKRSAGGL